MHTRAQRVGGVPAWPGWQRLAWAGCVAAYYPETNALVPLSAVATNAGAPTLQMRSSTDACSFTCLMTHDLPPPPLVSRTVYRLPASASQASNQAEAILNANRSAMHDMPARQVLNSVCGSLHAAGWVSPQGLLGEVMEDVGRHNALDKLLGVRARNGLLHVACAPGFVVMSSRASYELVRKCVRWKVPLLATISAPTDLAIQLAQVAGIQLWGLCRGDRANRYSA